jgi:ribosomal protein S18 acetylase RimI-like enzyme
MSGYDEVYENLASLLGTFGNMQGTRYNGCDPCVTLYDSGVADAYENYALLAPARPVEEAIGRGLKFFARSSRGHIWPIFPGVAGETCKILEGCGLARDADFHAMIAETSNVYRNGVDPDIVETISGDDEAGEWADNVWRGFDSDEEPPEPFVSNARGMTHMDAFTLVHVGLKATGMLFTSDITCGIYYVATRPEFRGLGFAGAIIERLKAHARCMGFERVVLLATSSGKNLYPKHGFADVGAVKIYRMNNNSEVL